MVDGYREKFCSSKPEDLETSRQFVRLQVYLHHWIEMSDIAMAFHGMWGLLVVEHFRKKCHVKLALFRKETNCKALAEMLEARDHFIDAQKQRNMLQRKAYGTTMAT